MLAAALDMRDLVRYAESLGAAADQVPFAASQALNEATEKVRQYLITTTWPHSGVKVRNQSFIGASLTTKNSRASKHSLSTEIWDRLDRGNLLQHALGGVHAPHSGSMVAVPASTIPRGAKGVPRGVRQVLKTKGGIRKKDKIYVRDGKGKLKLLFTLKPSTKIPKRARFFEDYKQQMELELNAAMPQALVRAMQSRRVR